MNITDGGNVGTGGARSAVGEVEIVVAPVNDPPVVILDPEGAGLLPAGGALGTDEDLPLSLALLSINDTEMSADGRGRLTVSLHCSNGGIGVTTGRTPNVQSEETVEGVVWVVGGLAEGAGVGPWQAVSFSGGLAESNEVLRKLEYSPAPDWHGVDDLTVSLRSGVGLFHGVVGKIEMCSMCRVVLAEAKLCIESTLLTKPVTSVLQCLRLEKPEASLSFDYRRSCRALVGNAWRSWPLRRTSEKGRWQGPRVNVW